MNTVRPNWDDLRIFAAIAATGSLTGAAAHLRLSQPTVGRRLQALEECVGATLLERTPRGMQLTAIAHLWRRARRNRVPFLDPRLLNAHWRRDLGFDN